MFKIFHKKIKKDFSRGFTLVEMTIVAGIFGILTAIVVFKYGDFTSNMLVTNMAYEIALNTRQAQVFGVGVRGYVEDDEPGFQFPYGIYFNLNDGSTGTTNQSKNFIFFIDRDNDQLCDNGTGQAGLSSCTCSAGDECLDQYTLQRNIRITEILLGNSCSGSGATVNAISAAISFKRPSPEARIQRQENPSDDGYAFAQIKVEAPGSKVNPSYVLIRKNGQISVVGNSICGEPSVGGGNGNSNE